MTETPAMEVARKTLIAQLRICADAAAASPNTYLNSAARVMLKQAANEIEALSARAPQASALLAAKIERIVRKQHDLAWTDATIYAVREALAAAPAAGGWRPKED